MGNKNNDLTNYGQKKSIINIQDLGFQLLANILLASSRYYMPFLEFFLFLEKIF